MKDKLIKNWKSCLLVVIAIVAFWVLPALFAKKTAEAPTITQVPNTSATTIQQYFPMVTKSEVKDISRQITRAKETKAPDYHYYAADQQTADAKAQELAKKQKADKVIKETETVPVEGKEDQSVIENNYYAINLERKHRVSVGAAVIDGKPYTDVKYRNRDVEYEVFYGLRNHEVGVGISYTVAKW